MARHDTDSDAPTAWSEVRQQARRDMEDQYQALYTSFRWWVPQRFNIADVCCRRWLSTSADARRIALYTEDGAQQRDMWTFARLQEYANRLSNGLRRIGVQRGDRVAIVLPQRAEAMVAHIATYQLGAVTVPLSTSLETAVYEQRLRDSEARIVIIDPLAAEAVLPAADRCPLLRQAIGVDVDDERVLSWRTLLARQESAFDMHPTASSDPAILLYNAGTTGPAKGVVLPHAALIGALPGFVASQNWFPQPGDVLWTASEWSSGLGLFGALLPALYFGQPLVAGRQALDAEATFDLLERYGVTNASLHPSALRGLLKGVPHAQSRYKLALRAVALAGAHAGRKLVERCREELGVLPNECFGQAEALLVIGNSHEKWPCKPGSMGRPYPGHQVALVTPDGGIVAPGTIGEIVVNRYDVQGYPDPALFLAYWRGEEAGRPSTGIWHHTGDLARVDEDGYYWYAGRAQDVFGADRAHVVVPDEVEAVLADHPLVGQAAVIARDPGTNTGVKAMVTLSHSFQTPSDPAARDALAAELLDYVRSEVLDHEVPEEIEFVDALPMTATGNVRRSVLRRLQEDGSRPRLPTPEPAVPAP